MPAPDRKKPAARDSGFKNVINSNELKKPGAEPKIKTRALGQAAGPGRGAGLLKYLPDHVLAAFGESPAPLPDNGGVVNVLEGARGAGGGASGLALALIAFLYPAAGPGVTDIAEGTDSHTGPAANAAGGLGGDAPGGLVPGKSAGLADLQAGGLIALEARYRDLAAVFKEDEVNLGPGRKVLAPVAAGAGQLAVQAAYAA